jgi:hypothetical protein
MPTEVPVRQRQQQQQTPQQQQRQQQQTPQHQQQQQQTPQQDDSDDEWLFSCRCESAKAVSTLLSCLKANSTGMQPVTVFLSPSAITFHVYGTARQSQASVDLQAGLFSEYHVYTPATTTTDVGSTTTEQQPGGEFCVNLSTVLECLHVLGTQSLDRTKLSLSYNLNTEIFKLELLEDGGVISTAAIPGMLPPTTGDSLALAFRTHPILARVIIKSELLRDSMSELDQVPGASCCTVVLGPEGLKLAAVGNLGECLLTTPAGSCVSLDCSGPPEARSYPLPNLVNGMRGLEFAEETCLSINANGMIAIQHQIYDLVGQGAPNFVDFIMTCLQDEDDDNSGTQPLVLSSQVSADAPYSWAWDEASKPTGGASILAHPTAASVVSAPSIGHDDDEEEEEEEDDLPPISKTPLFGTLTDTRPISRNVRRRRTRRQDDDDDKESYDNNDNSRDNGETLDVTARATPPRRRRNNQEDEYDGSSSPELVYK